jgi:hypothetical protein
MQNAATSTPLLEEPAAPQPAGDSGGYDYFSAVLPVTPTICGLRLRPLSVGRYRLMARFKVAFVSSTATTANAGDLLMGLLICSMGCDEFVEFAGSKNFSREVRRWGRRFGFLPPRCFGWPLVGKWIEKWLGASFAQSDARELTAKIHEFQKYIVDGSQPPPYFDESGGGRVSGAHWCHSIESVLRESQGWTKEEINEEPLSKALADYFKHMENEGIVQLMTEDQRKALETPMAAEKENEWVAFAKAVEDAKKNQGVGNA